MKTIGELMREEEERLIAEASTPERIAADAAQMKRNRLKMERELEALRRQGQIIEEGDEPEDEEEEDEA